MSYFPQNRPSESEAIEARAAAWLAQRDDGFTPDEEKEFARWCAADRRHAAAVHRLDHAWEHLQELRSYRPTARAHPDPDLLAPSPRRAAWRGLAWLGALPIAAALAFVALTWHRAAAPDSPAEEHRYATTSGGYERATLDDGSVIDLNANTEVRVSYRPTERRVILARGEAHFTVAKNPERPFWVEADGVGVRAVGTAFDVRMAHKGIEVLVTAGTVRVSRAAAATVSTTSANDATPLLTAGWRAIVPRSIAQAATVEKVEAAAIKELLSWQNARLTFVDMPLAEVIEQFNQRNDVQLSLGDPELAKMTVGGSFAADNVETFVRLLTSNGDIVADQSRPNQIVLRKAH